MDFPTLGLSFDLADLLEGRRRLQDARRDFVDVGYAADKAGDQAERAGEKARGAGLAAEAAAFRAKRAHNTEEQAIKSKMRELQQLDRMLRLMQTFDRVAGRAESLAGSRQQADAEKRIIQDVLDFDQNALSFRMRLSRQKAGEAIKDAQTVANAQKRADADATQAFQQALAFRMRMNRQRAGEEERQGQEAQRRINRLADAIKTAAQASLRGSQAEAEARVKITQSLIEQNRQQGLTREGLTREAMLVDRLTRELQELGQARAASARANAPAGANPDVIGAAAATTVVPLIGTAQRGLDSRRALLEENDARQKARTGVMAYMAAIFGLGRAYNDAGSRQRWFSSGLSGLGRVMHQARLRFFDLRFAIAALFAAVTLGPLAQMADQMVSLEARTGLYAKRASDVVLIQEDLFQTAQQARAPLEGVATLYARLAPLADQLGRSQGQMVDVVETVAKAFTLGGAAASEATAGAQQFAQALSSNRFGGDELRSVAENAPVLLAAIAEGVNQINPALNLNAATFIKWAHEGNANSEIMVRALELAKGKIDQMFLSMPVTIGQASTIIQNSLIRLVDEVDRRAGEAGMRLSTQLALSLAEFGEFLSSESTINAVVTTVQALMKTFQMLGQGIDLVADLFPGLVFGVVAFAAATKSAMIAAALAAAMKTLAAMVGAVSITFTGATAKMAIFNGVASLSTAAMAGLRGAAIALWTALTGPVGLALGLTAVALGVSKLNSDMLSLAETNDLFTNRVDGNITAMERAVAWLETYGGGTDEAKKQVEELNRAMDLAIGITDEQTRGMDEATAAAFRRAKMEQQLTVALLRRAAAESIGAAGDLERSALAKRVLAGSEAIEAWMIPRWSPGGRAGGRKDQLNERVNNARGAAGMEESLAADLRRQAPGLIAAADALEASPVTLPAITEGSGRSSLGRDDKDGSGSKSLNGAINQIMKLRAEVEGLNAQIAELDVDPLSDVAARIRAAGAEAAAQRTAGPGSVFADKARNLAMMKEEAQVRLELTRGIVEQTRRSVMAAEESTVAMETQAASFAAMDRYYAQGRRSSMSYAQAIRDQADAQLQGKEAMEDLRIAQQFGATSVNEISEVYQMMLEQAGLLTPETIRYADALEEQARQSHDAAVAALRLEEAQSRLEQENSAALARRAEITDLQDYAQALREGADALDEYTRRKRVNEELERAGPGPLSTGNAALDYFITLFRTQKIANDVRNRDEAAYNALVEERLSALREQERLAQLTTRARQEEAKAMELAAAAGRSMANDDDRRQARDILRREDLATMKTDIQDSIRDAFIETGKLDFSALRGGVERALRQAIYDALIAKPVTMVVNAVVNVVTKGLEKILERLTGGAEGDGGIGRMFENGMKDLGGQFKSLMDKLPQGLKTAVSQTLKFAGQAATGYAIGTSLADTVGLRGADSPWQTAGDIAGSIIGTILGGPIGGIIGTMASRLVGTLFGDKKRPLGLTALEVQDGQFRSRGTVGYDGLDTTEIDAAGKELARMLNQIAQVFDFDLRKAEGLYALFGWTAGENTKALGGEGFFGGMLKEFDSIRGMSLDQIKGSALGRGVDLSKVATADEAIDRILREMVIAMGEAVGEPFTEAEVRLLRAADSLEEAAKTLFAARNIEKNLDRALLQFTNPREFAVQNLRDQQLQRRREIIDLVNQGLVSEDRLPGIEAMLRELERAELGDVLGRFADGLDGAVSSLEDLRAAQQRLADYAQGLITGNLSPLSPRARLDASQSEFEQLLVRAQAGDAQAMERLTDASTDYLSAAQRFFASSPEYAAIFDQVYRTLTALSEQEFEDPLIGVIEAEIQRLIDAINAGFLLIYDGDPTRPDLPDQPDTPGTGGGGGGGDGDYPGLEGRGGGGRDIVDTLNRRFDDLEGRLGAVAEAMVASNDRGSEKVADAARDAPSLARALNGGGKVA